MIKNTKQIPLLFLLFTMFIPSTAFGAEEEHNQATDYKQEVSNWSWLDGASTGILAALLDRSTTYPYFALAMNERITDDLSLAYMLASLGSLSISWIFLSNLRDKLSNTLLPTASLANLKNSRNEAQVISWITYLGYLILF